MPIIELRDYNTDIFTRDEIILATTITSMVGAKIKEIGRGEIPKSIKINSMGIISDLLVLKLTIEYSVNILTYGYERTIALDESQVLFNSLKDKVNMEICGSAKRDDLYLVYSHMIIATKKKVEVKMTQNKSEIYIAKYNEMEKALIRTIHKGIGKVSMFSTISIGYDTKIGTMYYGTEAINIAENPKCCTNILEQTYVDFIAKLKNDGMYCPINEPISKEKVALGWSDKYRTYTNRVQFISILNAIGRIGCEESIKSTQQPKDVSMSNIDRTAITISAEARRIMEFIIEKCESIIKLLGKNETPEINIRQTVGDAIVFHIINNGIMSSHQVLRIELPYRYSAFTELYEYVTGNKPIATDAILGEDGEYPPTIKYAQLAQLHDSVNCCVGDKLFQTDLVACCKKNYPEIPKEILDDLDKLYGPVMDVQRKITKNMQAEQYLSHLDMLAKNILNQYNDTKACVMKGISEFIQKDISSDLVLGHDSLMERFKVGLELFTEADRGMYLSLIEAKIALHTLSKKYPGIDSCVHYEDDCYFIKNTHVPTGGSTQTNYNSSMMHYHVTIHMSTHSIGTDTYNALKDLHRVTTEVIKIMKTIEHKCNGNPIKTYYTTLNQK